MPLPFFEPLCAAIVLLALVAMARRRPVRALLADYVTLAVAAWIGEQTCILAYRFYGYAESWQLRLGEVPVLVPLIWPVVVLSAREVADALAPDAGRLRPLLVGALVAFDASLVEVIAVRAGLWSWAEPGHLDVPVIGILGWGFFALAADRLLALRAGWRHLAVAAGAPAAAHLLILGAWWGLFRWTARGDLGAASLAGIAAVGLVALGGGVASLRRGGRLPLAVAAPRMIAASLFVVLLVRVAATDLSLWLHTAAVAVPYFAVLRRSPPGPMVESPHASASGPGNVRSRGLR